VKVLPLRVPLAAVPVIITLASIGDVVINFDGPLVIPNLWNVSFDVVVTHTKAVPTTLIRLLSAGQQISTTLRSPAILQTVAVSVDIVLGLISLLSGDCRDYLLAYSSRSHSELGVIYE
jgi:hypothetical protein